MWLPQPGHTVWQGHKKARTGTDYTSLHSHLVPVLPRTAVPFKKLNFWYHAALKHFRVDDKFLTEEDKVQDVQT
jgi:hypothetical protein